MTENITSPTNSPIDVVITWVDGSDPILAKKRDKHLEDLSNVSSHPGVKSTRFASNDEIRYCILSIFKFAPFVRNVFIVTDEQQPNIIEEVRVYFPERVDSIRIVDHKEIFRGYVQHLPTFNSNSIESMIWRIEGLSENFVYFNDDVILLRDINPEDWVQNNRPVLRGEWRMLPLKKLFNLNIRLLVNRIILRKKDYHPKQSFYLCQWKAAVILGYRFRYFFHCHTPHVLNRVSLEQFFKQNPDLLMNNIKYRFRSEKQFMFTSLANHIEIKNDNKQKAKLNLGYLHPYYSAKRIAKKINRCNNDPSVKSVCVQSYDMLNPEVQTQIISWLNQILQTSQKPTP